MLRTLLEIDFILSNKRYRNSINSAKTYPVADAKTDQNPVIAQLEVRLKKTIPQYASGHLQV